MDVAVVVVVEGVEDHLLLPVLGLLDLAQLMGDDLDVPIRLVQQRVEEVHLAAHKSARSNLLLVR